MASMHPDNVTRPVETVHPDSLPKATHKQVAEALEKLVDQSTSHHDLNDSIHASAHSESIIKVLTWLRSKSTLSLGIGHIPFLKKLIPGFEWLANKYHIGNYVAMRGTDEKFFESMPIYAR
jgi:phosphatidylserine decarboxylase